MAPNPSPSMHPDRQNRQNRHKPTSKPPHTHPHSTKPSHFPPKPPSKPINPLKTLIRSTTRLLTQPHLPLPVRIEKERALAGYRQDLSFAQQEKKRNATISKYHMVRFFERQKATRNLKKLRRRVEGGEGGLEGRVREAEVDLKYTIFAPLGEKYVSLFPRMGGDGDEERGDCVGRRRGDLPMWKVVEECMAQGQLEELREGRLRGLYNSEGAGSQGKSGMSEGQGKEGRKRQVEAEKKDAKRVKVAGKEKAGATEEDEGSDGGFFEK